jgi:hypothetical protein
MEQENFESAMQDHKRALELLSTILQVCVHHSAPVFIIKKKIGIYYYKPS